MIALLFGRVLPLPGGLYPPGDGWKYRDAFPRLGPIAVTGTLAVAAVVAVDHALPPVAMRQWVLSLPRRLR